MKEINIEIVHEVTNSKTLKSNTLFIESKQRVQGQRFPSRRAEEVY